MNFCRIGKRVPSSHFHPYVSGYLDVVSSDADVMIKPPDISKFTPPLRLLDAYLCSPNSNRDLALSVILLGLIVEQSL